MTATVVKDTSQTYDIAALLQAEIRRSFGNAVYTHKTHLKQADILQRRLKHISLWQVVLSALTATGFIGIMMGVGRLGAIAGAALSTVLLCLNIYAQGAHLEEQAQQHRRAAVEVWRIREALLGLLVDLRTGLVTAEEARNSRNALRQELFEIYKDAPDTGETAFARATTAIKDEEEASFSDAEIDALLPESLRLPVSTEEEKNAIP